LKTIKRGVFITDTHWEAGKELHPSYLLVKKFIASYKPDCIVHGGDISDWDFLARFNQDKVKLLTGKSFVQEYDVINREMDFLQKHSNQLIVLAGNHDERVYVAVDKAPTLEGLIEFETQVKFKERGVKWYRATEQPARIGKLNAIHGWYHNKYHTNKHLDVYSGNLIYGHVHDFQTGSKVLQAHKEEIQAWSIGCLCDLNPEWLRGRPSGWQHGFAIFTVRSNGDFNLYPVNIIRNRFTLSDGKEWSLK
jgi:3',5'-cyclic AMP phosphodiesterase CpdA